MIFGQSPETSEMGRWRAQGIPMALLPPERKWTCTAPETGSRGGLRGAGPAYRPQVG